MKYLLLCLLFCTSQLFAASTKNPLVIPESQTEFAEDSKTTLAQSKKRKRRKKRRRKKSKPAMEEGQESETSGEAAAATGQTLHAAQEGQDQLYSKIISLSFSYGSKTSVSESDGVEGDPATTTSMNLSSAYLMRFGSIFAGPALSYFTTSRENYTYNSTSIGLSGRYYFADIDTATGAALAGASIFSGSTKSETSSGDTTVTIDKSSSSMVLFGGYAIFLDSNVSVDLGLHYTLSDKETSDSTTTNSSGYDLNASITTYL